MKAQTKHTVSKILARVIAFVVVLSLLAAPGVPVTKAAAPMQSYIVMGETTDQVVSLVEQLGGQVTSKLDIINGAGAMLTAEAAAKLAAQPGISITENKGMQLNVTPQAAASKDVPAGDYADVIGADAVWQAGITGKGVTVAVLDSGIAKMNGLNKNTTNKGNRIVGWLDLVDGRGNGSMVDPNGHGTHVAGVIANSQKGSDNEWNGVAPDVNLVIGRVADESGFATYERVIMGIAWVVLTKDLYKTRVLNFSMSSTATTPYWMDPINKALMVAWKSGIVVVASAGNNGPNALSIGVPGNNPYVITVGAFTDAYTPDDWSDDYIPTFSSAGPTYDGFIKPDLVAPGAHIVSLMGSDTTLAKEFPQAVVNNSYAKLAGTSQAAAAVSGLAALILQENPNLTPDQVKYRLRVTAIPQFKVEDGTPGYAVWQQGAGRAFAPTAVFANLVNGNGNGGMDITADLRNDKHYLGYSYRDENSIYRLFGDDGSWANGAGVWNGIGQDSRGVWGDGRGVWGDGRGVWGDAGYFYATSRGVWGDTRGYWADGGFFNASRGVWGDGRGVWGDSRGVWGDGRGFWGEGGFYGDSRGVWGDSRGVWGDSASYFTEGAYFAKDRTLWSAGEYFNDPNFAATSRGVWGDNAFWGSTTGFWGEGGFNVSSRGFWADLAASIDSRGVWGDWITEINSRGVWGDGRGVWGDGRGVWGDWSVLADGRGVWGDGRGVWGDWVALITGRGVWGDGRGVWGDGRGVWGDSGLFPATVPNNDD